MIMRNISYIFILQVIKFDLGMPVLFCFDHSNPHESFYQWVSLFLLFGIKITFPWQHISTRRPIQALKRSFYIPNIEAFHQKWNVLCIPIVFYRKKYPRAIFSRFLSFMAIVAPPLVAKIGTNPHGLSFLLGCSQLTLLIIIGVFCLFIHKGGGGLQVWRVGALGGGGKKKQKS